jgi:hypothetical protein
VQGGIGEGQIPPRPLLVFAPEVDAGPLGDEPSQGAEGLRAVLEVEVAGPSLHDAIDGRDDVGRRAS